MNHIQKGGDKLNIAKYCKDKGMTKEEYINFKNNITSTAKAILSKQNYTHGMYYPINDIINFLSDADIKLFIIAELKNLGFEFIENNTLYRY